MKRILTIFIFCIIFCCSKTEFKSSSKTKEKEKAKSQTVAIEVQNENSKITPLENSPEEPATLDEPCIEIPTSNMPDTAPEIVYQNLERHTYFYANVAVDPKGTKNDPATNFGFKAFDLSPDDSLSETLFSIEAKQLIKWVQEDKVKYMEWFVFDHEFGNGLDRVGIDFKTDEYTYTANSPSNIYSSYGFLSIENIHIVDDKPFADVKISALRWDSDSGQKLGLQTAIDGQDATKRVSQPISTLLAAEKTFTQIKLDGFKVTIRLYSDNYDSVQYRAIRANLWSPGDVTVNKCN